MTSSAPSRGATLTDVMAAVGVLAVGACLCTPMVLQANDLDRRQQCANNLRLLSAAAHVRANDHDGRFFYHWPVNTKDHDGNPEYRQWSSAEEVGRYLIGEDVGGMIRRTPIWEREEPSQGLGGGPFVCPSDMPGALRSYGMNFWASGARTPSYEKWLSNVQPNGQFFDSEAKDGDRLLLFTETLSSVKVERGWVTSGHLGMRPKPPGYRFGGRRGSGTHSEFVQDRIGTPFPDTDLDYARHTSLASAAPGKAFGSLNIAYADASVRFVSHDDLFDLATGASTFHTRWSPIDEQLPAQDEP